MLFEKDSWTSAGRRAGYVLGYFLFTTVLFIVLTVLGKLPSEWGYAHVMGAAFLIAVLGTALKRLLR